MANKSGQDDWLTLILKFLRWPLEVVLFMKNQKKEFVTNLYRSILFKVNIGLKNLVSRVRFIRENKLLNLLKSFYTKPLEEMYIIF